MQVYANIYTMHRVFDFPLRKAKCIIFMVLLLYGNVKQYDFAYDNHKQTYINIYIFNTKTI